MRSEINKDDSVDQMLNEVTNVPAEEPREITKEIVTEVTPGMIEAGKFALSSSEDQNKSLEHSIGEIYVAMAAEDHVAVNQQKQISDNKRGRRVKVWLYCGTFSMIIVAIGLLAMKIISFL